MNRPLADTGEAPLHAALCKTDRVVYDCVVKVLLSYGADPNHTTKAAVETGRHWNRLSGDLPGRDLVV